MIGGWWRRWLALLAATLALAGCFGPREPTPDELVGQAAGAIDQLNSVHFKLVIEGRPAFIDPGRTLNLRQAEGDLTRPDRAQTAARVAVSGFVVNVRFINIGERGYMTDPLSGRWGPMPGDVSYNPSILFAQEQGIGATMRRMTGLTKTGLESVDGVESHHLTGELSGPSLATLTGGVLPGEPVKVEVWIAREGASIRQIRLTEQAAVKAPMTWTLSLTRHDEPVAIEPPT